MVDMKTKELSVSNQEIRDQNRELKSQNQQINAQRIELEETHLQLKAVNENLEELVEKRTIKLEKTISQLDKTVKELDRFVYSASHDLSAPLKSILGLLNIAKLETDPAIIHQCHEHISQSILKLEQVIKSLVDFSRNSHLKVKKSELDLHVFVEELIIELKLWPETGIIQSVG